MTYIRPITTPTTRESNRAHWLLLAAGSDGMRWPHHEPAFFAGGSELDALETQPHLTPNERERRDMLREARAVGAIADPGECWAEFLAERGVRW